MDDDHPLETQAAQDKGPMPMAFTHAVHEVAIERWGTGAPS